MSAGLCCLRRKDISPQRREAMQRSVLCFGGADCSCVGGASLNKCFQKACTRNVTSLRCRLSCNTMVTNFEVQVKDFLDTPMCLRDSAACAEKTFHRDVREAMQRSVPWRRRLQLRRRRQPKQMFPKTARRQWRCRPHRGGHQLKNRGSK